MTETELSQDTRTRILEAAEQLFAYQGFRETSLRAITSKAGANLAAVNYHFGSKDDLIQEIFRRRIDPVNQARLKALNEIEAEAAPDSPDLEDILRAFLHPAVKLSTDPEHQKVLSRLYGRIHAEPSDELETMFLDLFSEVQPRFAGALHKALPDLPQKELAWRFHFMIGVMVYTMSEARKLVRFFPDLNQYDAETQTERIVRFVAAGFRSEIPPSLTRKES